MIRAVVFDLGKVLIDFDFKIAVSRLQKRCSFNVLKLLQLFTKHSLAEDFDRGIMPEKKFFETIQKEMDLPINMEEFIELWNGIFTEKKEMIETALTFKKIYKVGILSNTNPWHVEHLKKNHAWAFNFDAFVASCDVKMMKPEPEIYQLTLKKLKVMPEETFYIDDIAKNVAAAKKLGMDAIQFKNYSDFMQHVQSRNLLRLDC